MAKLYAGLFDDKYGGMTRLGQIVKDAWVFGLIPESETCKGWTLGQMESLYDKVWVQWEKHAHVPSRLPPDLAARHARIHDEAIVRARSLGWDPTLGEGD